MDKEVDGGEKRKDRRRSKRLRHNEIRIREERRRRFMGVVTSDGAPTPTKNFTVAKGSGNKTRKTGTT